MNTKDKREIFRLDHFKLKPDMKGELNKNFLLSVFTILQAVVFSILISSININTLLPWYTNKHVERITMISLSFILLIATAFVRRSHVFTIVHYSVVFTVSHIIFNYYFIAPKHFLQPHPGHLFPISKFRLHANFLFFIFNSILFSSFFIFIDYFAKSRVVYTQAPGLFTYIKSKAHNFIYGSKMVAIWSLKCSFVAFILYFCFLHSIFSIILWPFRISLFYQSTGEILFHLLCLCANNVFFYLAYLTFNYIVIFNISFSPSSVFYRPESFNPTGDSSYDKRQMLDSHLLQYHRIAVSYKNKEMTFKTRARDVRIVESMAEEVLGELKEIQTLFEACRCNLDSEMFVTVPQVNKRYTKKHRTHQILGLIFKKPCYKLKFLVLSIRFSLICDSLVEIFELVRIARELEGFQLLSDSVVNQIREVCEEISKSKLPELKDDRIVSLINKLQ